jgi:hypothetical protein
LDANADVGDKKKKSSNPNKILKKKKIKKGKKKMRSGCGRNKMGVELKRKWRSVRVKEKKKEFHPKRANILLVDIYCIYMYNISI